MGDSRYKRVSRSRPCLICGKPDWCSRAADESVSFCARITDGADRLSQKERWGVFYHDRRLFDEPRKRFGEPKNHLKQTEEIPLAPLEIRDFVYTALFRLSPASRYESLTTGKKGLRERGLINYDDYGSLPCSAQERKNLAARLRLLLNQNFPSFVRENPLGIAHVPGFWTNENGEACLWQNRDYSQPLLLVPYRSPARKIQACQIRFADVLPPDKKRYLWLSLPKMNSAGTGTPLHFENWKTFGQMKSDQPILITEGALKADVVTKFCPHFFAIANSGVGCAHALIVNVSRGKPVYLAFDNDYHDKPAVARQLARLLKLRLYDNHNNGFNAETKILVWMQSEKGIDDALAKNEKICGIEVTDWFFSLNKNCRETVRKVWDDD